MSGWILVTRDPSCIEDFKRRYYGEGSKDFEERGILVSVKGEEGLYLDVFTIPLARKKKELEELVGGDLERAINMEFKKVDNKCEAEVRYASRVFLLISRLVNSVIKSIETTALLRAKATRSQQPAT